MLTTVLSAPAGTTRLCLLTLTTPPAGPSVCVTESYPSGLHESNPSDVATLPRRVGPARSARLIVASAMAPMESAHNERRRRRHITLHPPRHKASIQLPLS